MTYRQPSTAIFVVLTFVVAVSTIYCFMPKATVNSSFLFRSNRRLIAASSYSVQHGVPPNEHSVSENMTLALDQPYIVSASDPFPSTGYVVASEKNWVANTAEASLKFLVKNNRISDSFAVLPADVIVYRIIAPGRLKEVESKKINYLRLDK
jgi:hypothetical protein